MRTSRVFWRGGKIGESLVKGSGLRLILTRQEKKIKGYLLAVCCIKSVPHARTAGSKLAHCRLLLVHASPLFAP